MATQISKDNFDSIVMKSDKPVLIDFWAQWCGPCRMLTPVMEKLSGQYNGKAVIGKINVDEQNELASAFGVRSIPTVVLMKNGKVVDRAVGVRPYQDYEKMINSNM